MGFLLVDKPAGLPSFQVVRKIRAVSGLKKVGFAGTLDPFASGLLVLALGRQFTRELDRIQAMPKTYEVTIVLGIGTDTLDAYGKIDSETNEIPKQTQEKIRDPKALSEALSQFVGEMDQLPPQFSAKKVNGVRAYAAARAGEALALKTAPVNVYSLELLGAEALRFPQIRFRARCSKGTYVRSLVRDIGSAMKCPAFAKNLKRTRIGNFDLSSALAYNDLSAASVQERLFTNVE
jgi:tRNA pseudouridine55 synthase